MPIVTQIFVEQDANLCTSILAHIGCDSRVSCTQKGINISYMEVNVFIFYKN